MALKTDRRTFSVGLAGLSSLVFASACQTNGALKSPFVVSNAESDPSKETVLVLLPEEERVLALVDSLRHELETDFNVRLVPVGPKTTEWDVEGLVATHEPKLVVLLNNPTVHLYASWAAKKRTFPVCLILMSSFAGELVNTVPNSTAISWEVPIATSVQGLRGLGLKVHRVGVLYRRAFTRQIERERELARPEKAEFIAQKLGDHPSSRELKAAIVRLRRARVDALWIPNDNGLLRAEYLTQVWAPYLQYFGAPVIVGVPTLVRGDLRLGSYAASPDLAALGVQAADRIYDISDANWRLPALRIAEAPLSVKTYLSVRAVDDFGISQDSLGSVDYLIENKRGFEK